MYLLPHSTQDTRDTGQVFLGSLGSDSQNCRPHHTALYLKSRPWPTAKNQTTMLMQQDRPGFKWLKDSREN